MLPTGTSLGRAAVRIASAAILLVGCSDGATAECSRDLQCASPVACSVPTCDDGTCRAQPDDTRCAPGERCDVDAGCIPDQPSADATVDRPAVPTCTDGSKNGLETGIDCGGADCPACANGGTCNQGTDCMTTLCDPISNRCRFARSCLELRELGTTADGTYAIDPDGESEAFTPFFVFCDMTTDGGGWTEITPALARHELNGAMVALEPATEEAFEAGDQPCTRDSTGNHAYHYTFDFVPGYSEFFLEGFSLRAFAAEGGQSELDGASFTQSSWEAGHGGSSGDVSFGSPFDDGPLTSFAAELDTSIACGDCIIEWPPGRRVFSLRMTETAFRIGWGEAGADSEGWCPWWGGTIRVR